MLNRSSINKMNTYTMTSIVPEALKYPALKDHNEHESSLAGSAKPSLLAILQASTFCKHIRPGFLGREQQGLRTLAEVQACSCDKRLSPGYSEKVRC